MYARSRIAGPHTSGAEHEDVYGHRRPTHDAPTRSVEPQDAHGGDAPKVTATSFAAPHAWWDELVSFALGLVMAIFLFLSVPLTQTLSADDPELRVLEETAIAIKPPEIEEFEAEPETLDEPEPEPELTSEFEPPQLTLDQLDIALNVGIGGSLAGDFSMPNLGAAKSAALDPEEFVDFADLDQMPRPIGVTGFRFPPRLKRKAARGRIVLLLRLSSDGEVISATVESSDLPRFDDFIRNEVESWRFTPPTQHGRPVKAHARLPIPIRIS